MSTPDPHVVYRQYLDAIVLNGLAIADAAGLHPTDLYALSALDLAGPLTSGELAARTGLTTGATTRLIDRLEKRGHVRRTADPTDRRRVVIELDPEGSSEIDRDIDAIVGPSRRHIGELLLGRYTEEQRAVLFDYFEHAAPAMRKATEEIRAAS